MRKWFCLLCALCLLVNAAAPALGEGLDFYANLLAQTEALSALNAEATQICAGALSELEDFAVAYQAALQTLGTYDLDGYKAGLQARGAQMDACAERIRGIREGLLLMDRCKVSTGRVFLPAERWGVRGLFTGKSFTFFPLSGKKSKGFRTGAC